MDTGRADGRHSRLHGVRGRQRAANITQGRGCAPRGCQTGSGNLARCGWDRRRGGGGPTRPCGTAALWQGLQPHASPALLCAHWGPAPHAPTMHAKVHRPSWRVRSRTAVMPASWLGFGCGCARLPTCGAGTASCCSSRRGARLDALVAAPATAGGHARRFLLRGMGRGSGRSRRAAAATDGPTVPPAGASAGRCPLSDTFQSHIPTCSSSSSSVAACREAKPGGRAQGWFVGPPLNWRLPPAFCRLPQAGERLAFCAWRLPIARAALPKCRLRQDAELNPNHFDR